MRRFLRSLVFGMVALSLTVVGSPASADGEGGPAGQPFRMFGSSTNGDFDPSTCVTAGVGVIDCAGTRTASLVGAPVGRGSWSTAGRVVVDLTSSCTDHLGRTSQDFTGGGDGVITANDGSELFVRRDYIGCGSAAAGGYSIGLLTFTGGTGRFDGASGVALFVIVTEDPPTGRMAAIGHIAY